MRPSWIDSISLSSPSPTSCGTHRSAHARLWPFLLAGCALALAGCHSRSGAAEDAGTPDAGFVQRSEHEPNDTLDTAMPVRSSAEIAGSLALGSKKGASAADEDWYRLSPSAGSPGATEADLHLSGLPGAKIQLELFDAGHDRLAQVSAVAEGKPVELLRVGLHAPVWVRVSSETKGAGGGYTFTVLFHPAQPGWEAEPNDRAADATPVAFDTLKPGAWTVSGLVGHSDDEDWYRIVLVDGGTDSGLEDAGSTLGFAPSPDAGSALAVTSPAAPSERLDAGRAAPAPNSGQAATTPAPAKAPSQLATGTVPSGLSSGLTPKIPEPLPLPLPPPAMATTGTTASADAGSSGISPPGATASAQSADAGWGFAPPPPRVPLRIELSAVSGVTPQVTVLTAAQAQLFQAEGEDGQGLLLRNVGVRATDRVIYVVVRSAWSGKGASAKRGYNAVQPYTLTVSREPAGSEAEIEPNEGPADATALPLEGFRDGYISPQGDVDTFVLHCPTPTLTDLKLSGVDQMDLELRVLRAPPDGGTPKRVMRANDGDVKEPEYLESVACNGSVWVQVASALRKVDGKWTRPWANSKSPYRLTAKSRPDTGAEEREPNDDADDATSIALGQVIRGTIQPKRDEDDYRLDLSKRLVKTSLRAAVTGVLGLHIGLYLYRVEPDGKVSLVQTADRARDLRPEIVRYGASPGVYILQVKDVHGRAANFQDAYQLSVREGG